MQTIDFGWIHYLNQLKILIKTHQNVADSVFNKVPISLAQFPTYISG